MTLLAILSCFANEHQRQQEINALVKCAPVSLARVLRRSQQKRIQITTVLYSDDRPTSEEQRSHEMVELDEIGGLDLNATL